MSTTSAFLRSRRRQNIVTPFPNQTLLLPVFVLLLLLLLASQVRAGKLHTSGRWIVDEDGARFKLRCINWAGHMEAKVPEGLQHQSIDTIAAWVADNNFNCVRLTYSTEMALSPDEQVSSAFAAVPNRTSVDTVEWQEVYTSVLKKNPIVESSTVLDTFELVIAALGKHDIKVILDNHVSNASWCCGYDDGNGYWDISSTYNPINTRYFETTDWLNGLSAMASVSLRHPNVVGMSLRNELRALGTQNSKYESEWYDFVTRGAEAIHTGNQDLLIMVGGLRSATNLRYLRSRPLDTSKFPNRVVWEFHTYSWTYYFLTSICPIVNNLIGYYIGFLLQPDQAYTGPLWLGEFGWGQDGMTEVDSGYLQCVKKFMISNDVDWAYWALQGSYYLREGTIDYDESYGLLTKDWSGWRNPKFPELLGEMWNVTQGPDVRDGGS